MTTISTDFTAVGVSAVLRSQQEGESISVAISGTYDMTIRLERAVTSDESAWETIKIFNTEDETVAFVHRAVRKGDRFRLHVTVDGGGTAVTTLADEDEVHVRVLDHNGQPIYTIRESGMLIHQRPQHDDDVGTPVANIAAVHYSADGVNFTTILTLDAYPILHGDNASLATGVLIYTMPAGDIAIKAAAMSVGITTLETPTTDDPELGVGSVEGAGAAATLGAAGATMEDIIEGIASVNMVGTAVVVSAQRAMTMLAAGVHTIFFNMADGYADLSGTDGTLTGTVTISWSKLPLS